jgi:hypothetical protein
MNKPARSPIDEALESARALPEPVQDALAAEIMARVEQLSQSLLTDAQRAEIEARLAAPPRYADPTTVKLFFARHGVIE